MAVVRSVAQSRRREDRSVGLRHAVLSVVKEGGRESHGVELRAVWLVVFFFQAEDGIRDVAVTGVQTCALPISVEVIERVGDQAHVRTASGREGWVRASYLTAEEPLRARLAERTAEVARLKEDLGRLTAQPEAARTSARPAPGAQPPPRTAANAAVAAEPPEEAVRAPRGGLFGRGPDERGRRVWPWALGSALVALIVGFALGALVLDRHIRRKYGGLRIY